MGRILERGPAWTEAEDKLLLALRKTRKGWKPMGYEEIALRITALSGRVTTGRNCCNRYHRLCGDKAYMANRYTKPITDEPKPKTVPRKCLGPVCRGQRTFESTGAGHRVCQNCREAMAGLHMGYV
jgi:hypothetical protein